MSKNIWRTIEKNKKIILLIICLLFYTYFIHEPAHYLMLKYFNYEAKINFLKFPPQVDIDFSKIHNLNHLFLSTIAPYLVSFGFLFILLLLSLIMRNRKFIFLSLIPLLDILLNFISAPIAYFLKKSNDFIILFHINIMATSIICGASLIFFILITKLNKSQKVN